MANIHLSALHDRIDEEHFEMRLHSSAIHALQQRVILLEAAVRELRRLAFADEDIDRPQHADNQRPRPRDRRKSLSRQDSRAARRAKKAPA